MGDGGAGIDRRGEVVGNLFHDGGDICVFLRGGAGFGGGGFDMGDDFIVGENGGLGFEDLHRIVLGGNERMQGWVCCLTFCTLPASV